MNGFFVVGSLFGFFVIMLICMLAAVIFAFAKQGFYAWLLYVIGAGVQLFLLINRNPSPLYWIVYFVLLVAAAAVIAWRSKEAKEEPLVIEGMATGCECLTCGYKGNYTDECPECGSKAKRYTTYSKNDNKTTIK